MTMWTDFVTIQDLQTQTKVAQTQNRGPSLRACAHTYLWFVSLPVFDLAFLAAVPQAQPARAQLQFLPVLAAGCIADNAQAELAEHREVERVAARRVRVADPVVTKNGLVVVCDFAIRVKSLPSRRGRAARLRFCGSRRRPKSAADTVWEKSTVMLAGLGSVRDYY